MIQSSASLPHTPEKDAMIIKCSSLKILKYLMCMTHFAEACRMIIAELNFWWPLLKKPGFTWKPFGNFIPGQFHPVVFVCRWWSSCVSKAHLMNLGTSWLGFGRVEWVRNELKVLNGCSIKNNYRFIWFNSVILCLQSTFNEFGDQLTGFWTSWTGPKFTFSGSPRHDVNGQPIVIIESSVEMQ